MGEKGHIYSQSKKATCRTLCLGNWQDKKGDENDAAKLSPGTGLRER